MNENKDLMNNSTQEPENITEVSAEVETEAVEETKSESKFSFKKRTSSKLKNEAMFKRGSMSVAITAIFLACLIILNVLVSALSSRIDLTFDMTTQKVNTISKENEKFIKDIEDKVEITVFATEDNYVEYISYYAESYYQTTANADYFEQTLSLIKKYEDYNKNIDVKFVDPQSTEFTAYSSNYSTIDFIPGDIFVVGTKNGSERQKKIGFADIYQLGQDSSYAAYGGYGSYTINGNNIETALTSAIAYVTSNEIKKAAFITGHSIKNYTSKYAELLEDNNYDVDVISDQIIKSISSEYDVVIIMAPSIDFLSEELDALSAFLDNDGKLGKGLMFFGDASYPMLPNFSEFLVEWGIEINDGILFETNADNRSTEDPCTMILYAMVTDLTNNMGGCIAGYNIPMKSVEPSDDSIMVTEYMMTSETVVVAPVGVAKDWTDYTDSDKGQFAGVLESKKLGENENSSYVMAFSSVEYIQSEQWAESSRLSNKDITLSCTNIAANVSEETKSFVTKTISDESFTDSVTAGSVKTIRFIFMIALPIVMIVIGIYIYIRRRNA